MIAVHTAIITDQGI